MKAAIFLLLVVCGLAFCEAWEIYIREVDSQDPTRAVLVQNCESGGKGPSYVTVDVWTPNPFGERTDAYFYYKNATTGDWVQFFECGVLQYGKECNVRLPLYLGGTGERTETLELIKATMSRGSTRYEAEMSFPLNHVKTTKETIVENKTAEYRRELSDAQALSFCSADGTLCCKLKEDLSALGGLDNRSAALLKECRVDDARLLLEGAINDLRSIKDSSSHCSAAIAEITNAESLANSRGCNSSAVRTQIDALKARVRDGNYETSLAALNSAMSSQCLGAQVQDVAPGDAPPAGTPAGSQPPSTQPGGSDKPMCPSMLVLLALLPFAVFRWGS
ncbi:MAG TPA: hypothetical protein PKJ97_02020 [Candidatus Bilamarchaeaceae archaeon]|nr:hypothetical protein [Candidatus Bilamarchaeaceae archaeon]